MRTKHILVKPARLYWGKDDKFKVLRSENVKSAFAGDLLTRKHLQGLMEAGIDVTVID